MGKWTWSRDLIQLCLIPFLKSLWVVETIMAFSSLGPSTQCCLCFCFNLVAHSIFWHQSHSFRLNSYPSQGLCKLSLAQTNLELLCKKIRITEVILRSCGREKWFYSANPWSFPLSLIFLLGFAHSHPHSAKDQWLMVTGDQGHLCAVLCDKGHWLSWLTVSFSCDKRLIWDLSLMPMSTECSLGSFASLFHFTFYSLK